MEVVFENDEQDLLLLDDITSDLDALCGGSDGGTERDDGSTSSSRSDSSSCSNLGTCVNSINTVSDFSSIEEDEEDDQDFWRDDDEDMSTVSRISIDYNSISISGDSSNSSSSSSSRSSKEDKEDQEEETTASTSAAAAAAVVAKVRDKREQKNRYFCYKCGEDYNERLQKLLAQKERGYVDGQEDDDGCVIVMGNSMERYSSVHECKHGGSGDVVFMSTQEGDRLYHGHQQKQKQQQQQQSVQKLVRTHRQNGYLYGNDQDEENGDDNDDVYISGLLMRKTDVYIKTEIKQEKQEEDGEPPKAAAAAAAVRTVAATTASEDSKENRWNWWQESKPILIKQEPGQEATASQDPERLQKRPRQNRQQQQQEQLLLLVDEEDEQDYGVYWPADSECVASAAFHSVAPLHNNNNSYCRIKMERDEIKQEPQTTTTTTTSCSGGSSGGSCSSRHVSITSNGAGGFWNIKTEPVSDSDTTTTVSRSVTGKRAMPLDCDGDDDYGGRNNSKKRCTEAAAAALVNVKQEKEDESTTTTRSSTSETQPGLRSSSISISGGVNNGVFTNHHHRVSIMTPATAAAVVAATATETLSGQLEAHQEYRYMGADGKMYIVKVIPDSNHLTTAAATATAGGEPSAASSSSKIGPPPPLIPLKHLNSDVATHRHAAAATASVTHPLHMPLYQPPPPSHHQSYHYYRPILPSTHRNRVFLAPTAHSSRFPMPPVPIAHPPPPPYTGNSCTNNNNVSRHPQRPLAAVKRNGVARRNASNATAASTTKSVKQQQQPQQQKQPNGLVPQRAAPVLPPRIHVPATEDNTEFVKCGGGSKVMSYEGIRRFYYKCSVDGCPVRKTVDKKLSTLEEIGSQIKETHNHHVSSSTVRATGAAIVAGVRATTTTAANAS